MMASFAPASNNFRRVGKLSRIRFSLAIRFVAGWMGELMSTLSRTVFPLKSNSLRAFILATGEVSRCPGGFPVWQIQIFVRLSDSLQPIGLHAHRCANRVDSFRD